MKGYMTVEDKGGKRTRVNISHVSGLPALGTFVSSFDSYTNGKIIDYAVIQPNEFAGTLQAGQFESVENKLSLTFKWVEDFEKRIMRLSIPAPDDDMLEWVDGIGYRAVKIQGDALAMMLRTLTGITGLTYSRGTYLSKPTQPQI
jgi:hypothetical protein